MTTDEQDFVEHFRLFCTWEAVGRPGKTFWDWLAREEARAKRDVSRKVTPLSDPASHSPEPVAITPTCERNEFSRK